MLCVLCAVNDDEVDWMAACVETDVQHRRWSNFAEEMDRILSADDFVVDAVHVMQVICFEHYTYLKTYKNRFMLFFSVLVLFLELLN